MSRVPIASVLSIVAVARVCAAEFVITRYGAVGDGMTPNTAAIQQTIDSAHDAGGGQVVIPVGTFRSGAIFLKSGVHLHIADGGVLLGSGNIEDYPKRETRIEGHLEPWRMALINADDIQGLRISGSGTVNGNGAGFWAAFWQRRRENPQCTNLEVERPRLMFIDGCSDVRITGLRLRDSGFWNVHLYRCRDVLLEDVDILTPTAGPPVRAPSSDGIDIDSCQNVIVRRCVISVDDDCIALKGTKGPRAAEDTASPPVENILIEQCKFRAGHGVLTCGSEATLVRNVVMRDCDVTGRINLVRLKLRPDTPQRYENLLFENIRLDGDGRVFDVNPWTQFFDLQGHEPPKRSVEGVILRNITGRYGTMGRIVGNPGDTIADIRIENVDLTLADERFERGPVTDFVAENVVINGQSFTP